MNTNSTLISPDPLLYRAFELTLEPGLGDGRTVEGLIVPFGQIADVVDREGRPYREIIEPGAFSKAVKAPNRVDLRVGHTDRYGDVIGFARHLEEREDGLYGEFQVYESEAPKAMEMLHYARRSLSIGFLPLQNRRVGNVVHRMLVRLDHVAAVAEGAYSAAKILAFRSENDHDSGQYERELPAELEPAEVEFLDQLKADDARAAAALDRAKAVLGG